MGKKLSEICIFCKMATIFVDSLCYHYPNKSDGMRSIGKSNLMMPSFDSILLLQVSSRCPHDSMIHSVIALSALLCFDWCNTLQLPSFLWRLSEPVEVISIMISLPPFPLILYCHNHRLWSLFKLMNNLTLKRLSIRQWTFWGLVIFICTWCYIYTWAWFIWWWIIWMSVRIINNANISGGKI